MTKKQSESHSNFWWNLNIMQMRERSPWICYVIAIAIVIAAAAVRFAFLGALVLRAPYMTFYPAVMIVTIICGLPAGILATFLSALIASYFWIEPVYQLYIRDLADWLGLLIFIMSCLVVAFLSAVLRRAEIRRIETEAQVKLLIEHERANELLQQSEERYRKVVEDQTELISRYKTDGTYTFVNDAFCRFFGKTRDELMGSPWYPDAFPEDVAIVEEQLQTLSPSHPVVVIENRVYSSSGEVRWMQFVNRGIFTKEGRIIETQSVGRDITERKNMERALHKSEERLNLALNASKMGVWEWNVQTRVLIWSPECFDILGTVEFNGMLESFTNMLHPDDADRVMAAVAKTLAEKTAYSAEYRIIRSDGQVRWLLDKAWPTFDEEGNPLQLTGTIQDITERKIAENELRESKELLNTVINGAEDSIFLKDRDSRYILANPATLRVLGKTAEEVVGKKLTDIHTDPAIANAISENDYRIMRSGQAESIEETVQFGLNSRTFISSKTPKFDAEGQVIGLICISHDITERKLIEDELKSSEERYRRLFEMEFDAVLMIDWETGQVLDVNVAALRMYGYSKEKFMQLTAADLSAEPSVTEESIRNKENLEHLRLHRKKDGLVFPVDIVVTYFDFRGRKVCVAAIRDITERKQTENALIKSEEKYRALFEESLDAVFLTIPDGSIVDANSSACKLFDMTVQEICRVGRAGIIDMTDARLAPVLEERKRIGHINTELICIRKNGERFPAEISSVIVSDDPPRSFVILRDISERRQAENELRSYARRLIEIEEDLRKKLAAELHDEIGRDLTALGMNLAFIDNSLTDKTSKSIGARVKDMAKLTIGISRTVRDIMTGLRPPVLDDFGLLAALRWHADQFIKRTGVEVLIQVDDPFPRVTIETEAALFRIAQEALINAAKHADTQVVTIQLRITAGTLRLSVCDEGKGFMPALSSEYQKASGWGMKIMRERAELIGGIFQVDSAPGKGTVVSVELPLEAA